MIISAPGFGALLLATLPPSATIRPLPTGGPTSTKWAHRLIIFRCPNLELLLPSEHMLLLTRSSYEAADDGWLGLRQRDSATMKTQFQDTPSCGMAQWYVEPAANHAVDGQGYSVALSGTGVLAVNGVPNLNSSYTLGGLGNSNWSNTTWENHLLTSGWQLMSNPYLATLQQITSNTGLDSNT